MNKAFRTLLLSICFFGFPCMLTYAQQDHFVYIQSDEKVSFDVNVNGKTYNSSSIGYVILPKLTKGNYLLSVSFANKKYPDQQFNCPIDKDDEGFLLKNYTDKGWGLFNLQSSDIIMAVSADTVVPEPPKAQPGKNDAFGNMLSEVSGDSTLNLKTEVEKPAAQKTSPAVEPAAVAKNQNSIPQKDGIDNNIDNNKVIGTAILGSKTVSPVDKNNVLVKIKEETTNDGTNMVFLDSSSGLNDTISIFLPTQPSLADVNEVQTKTLQKDSTIEGAKTDSNANVKAANAAVVKQPDTSTTENGGVNNPFFSKEDQKKNDTNVTADNGVNNNSDIKAAPANMPSSAECKNVLTESDMSKIRKKMITAENDDKMIGIAKKNIGDKCISTEQVKSLAGLFLSDDGRLNFFSSVYSLVYDKPAFSSLESQLIDPNYKKRFRDLTK